MPVSAHRRLERRRSVRVTMSVPLRVDGQTIAGEAFTARTHTHLVSEFGCMLQLDQEVLVDQMVVVMNEHTRQSAQCRVVFRRRHRDGKQYIGVEFTSHGANFWRMVFSKPGARSLKRYHGSGP